MVKLVHEGGSYEILGGGLRDRDVEALVPHGEECGVGIESSLSDLADLKMMY